MNLASTLLCTSASTSIIFFWTFPGVDFKLQVGIMLMPQLTPINATFPMQRLQLQVCDIGEKKEEALKPVEDDGYGQ